jgi:hypothetical protein
MTITLRVKPNGIGCDVPYLTLDKCCVFACCLMGQWFTTWLVVSKGSLLDDGPHSICLQTSGANSSV